MYDKFKKLQSTLVRQGVEELSVLPVLLLTVYSKDTLKDLAPATNEAIAYFVSQVPHASLISVQKSNGDFGRLTANKVRRDAKLMASPPEGEEFLGLTYSSREDGPPNEFGVKLIAHNLAQTGFEDFTNLLRFELPIMHKERVDSIVELATRITEFIPNSMGTFGVGLSHLRGDRFAGAQVFQMLPRYIGLEHSSDKPRDWMRNKTPAPNWITFVEKEIFEELGGTAKLRDAAPTVIPVETAVGFVLRASSLPPLGDINRHAGDIGELPGVARFLKPRRTKIPFLRAGRVEVDVDAWLSRFDELENRPWNNA